MISLSKVKHWLSCAAFHHIDKRKTWENSYVLGKLAIRDLNNWLI